MTSITPRMDLATSDRRRCEHCAYMCAVVNNSQSFDQFVCIKNNMSSCPGKMAPLVGLYNGITM
jgi:hypothetical protein